jgi:hypothetical protein
VVYTGVGFPLAGVSTGFNVFVTDLRRGFTRAITNTTGNELAAYPRLASNGRIGMFAAQADRLQGGMSAEAARVQNPPNLFDMRLYRFEIR